MTGHIPRRVVLFFSRSPENEARMKPLSGRFSHRDRVRMYEHLTGHVLAEARNLRCPIIVATDDPEYDYRRYSERIAAVIPQRGSSFGDRLSRALDDAFNAGYDEVVCVGNDCPEMTSADLHLAFKELGERSLALGAAVDGGVFLIGLNRRCYEVIREQFAACRWETPEVLEDLLEISRCANITSLIVGSYLDIDTAPDLVAMGGRYPHLHLLRRLADQLHRRAIPESGFPRPVLPSRRTLRLQYQKAPPSLLCFPP